MGGFNRMNRYNQWHPAIPLPKHFGPVAAAPPIPFVP
jgi:hypothetical protein